MLEVGQSERKFQLEQTEPKQNQNEQLPVSSILHLIAFSSILKTEIKDKVETAPTSCFADKNAK